MERAEKRLLRLGYSSCPNDTFVFKAIARDLIDGSGYCFDIRLEDVETLNQKARNRTYDITKLSVAALGGLLDRYALLRSGAALGQGCGPLIVTRPGRRLDEIDRPVIAVPGMQTTACHLLHFFMADRFAGRPFDLHPMRFETIMPAVLDGQADFGVIIHEGRFVYRQMDLVKTADLGQWWEDRTGLPIPLGCIAVRRDMERTDACRIQELIRESIDHAFAHPGAARDYIRQHARELEENVIQQHIDLYVNHFSRDLGTAGTQAVTAFFDHAERAGLMTRSDDPLFAC